MATAFASGEDLTPAELRDAELRSIPRPSLLAEPLAAGKQAAKGLAALGIETHGDLIEHLPHSHRDRREVRGVGSVGVGEEAILRDGAADAGSRERALCDVLRGVLRRLRLQPQLGRSLGGPSSRR